jgi:ABC-type dipeptide/oligopeptide/nickel transport system ATPase subunit
MIDINKNLRSVLDKIFNISAFGHDKKQPMRLRIGEIRSVLVPQKSLFIRNGKYSSLDFQGGFGWIKRRGDFFLYPKSESNPHMVISGMSGFGKSTLFKSILLDIISFNLPCIIFDAHNEHSQIVRSLNGMVHNAIYSGINILELDGASVSERISELSRLFRQIYGLGYIQTTKLSECLWYTYRKSGARSRSDKKVDRVPTIRDLLDELNVFIKNSKGVGERNTLLHLKDKISLLNSSAFSGNFTTMEELQKGLHSFALANMKSRESQLIYIGELLNRIYSTMHDMEGQNALRLYIMIDEAQFLTDNSDNNSIISKLIEEGRKYGIGVIIVTHAASTLNKKVIANAASFITFYAREPAEVSFISKVLSGGDIPKMNEVRNMLGRLKQNQAILVSSIIRAPVLISTPIHTDIKINTGGISEIELKELLRMKAKRPVRVSEIDPKGIYSGLIGNLANSGFLDCFVDEIDGGTKWIMLHSGALSIEHEVWVSRISSCLSANGIQNSIIDNSNGPDISVLKNGVRIALEYETGFKRMESTLEMVKARLYKYSVVIIITKPGMVNEYRIKFSAVQNVTVMEDKDLRSVVGFVKNL